MKQAILLLCCILYLGSMAQPGCPSHLSTSYISGPDTAENDYDQTFRSLAINPKNPNHVVVGSEGNAIFISYDGGLHWSWKRKGFRHFTNGYAETWYVAFDTQDTSVIYASTADSPGPATGSVPTAAAGVYKSSDHGENWNQRNCGLEASSASAIWVDKDSSKNLIVSTAGGSPSFTGSPLSFYAGGIYYSSDSGANWAKASTPMNIDTTAFWRIIPAGNTIFTCAVSTNPGRATGFLKSNDKGKTWVSTGSPLPGRMLPDFAVSYDGLHLVTIVRDSAVAYTSDDGGDSWTRINISVSGVLAFHPQSIDTLFFTDQNLLYKSKNRMRTGNLFSPDYKKVATFSHVIEKIVFAESDPRVMYVSTRGYRVYKSIDGGESFTEVANLRDIMQTALSDSLKILTDTVNSVVTGDTVRVAITSNTNWSVSNMAGWVTVTPLHGSGNGMLTIMIEANTGAERITGITIATENITRTLYIRQAAFIRQLSLGKDSISGAADGNTITVQLMSNTSWTVSNAADWITVKPLTGTGDSALQVVMAANPGAARVTTIGVIAGTITRTIYISQAAFIPNLVLGQDSIISTFPGDTISIAITSNTSWAVHNPLSWITVSPSGGSGSAALMILISNNTGGVRTGTLTVTSGNITRTIYVYQRPFVASLEVEVFVISVSAAGDMLQIPLTSNTSWAVHHNAPWVLITPVSGSGDKLLSVMISANTGAERADTVTVTAENITRTVYIFQANDTPTGIDEMKDIGSFSVFPNPTAGILNLKNDDAENSAIEVFDSNGKKMDSFVALPGVETRLDYSFLASGLYLIRIKGNKQSQVRFVIIR